MFWGGNGALRAICGDKGGGIGRIAVALAVVGEGRSNIGYRERVGDTGWKVVGEIGEESTSNVGDGRDEELATGRLSDDVYEYSVGHVPDCGGCLCSGSGAGRFASALVLPSLTF